MVPHTLKVTILAALLVGCGHSTDRERAKIRVDDFAYSRVDGELLVGMTLLNSGRQSLWFWGQGPNDPCQFYQKWEAGQWRGALMASCDMSPTFFELAAGDDILIDAMMGRRDTIRVGYVIRGSDSGRRLTREETQRGIRWSDAIAFDSTRVTPFGEWMSARGHE